MSGSQLAWTNAAALLHTQWRFYDHACVTGIVTARLHMHCKKQASMNMRVAEALVSAVPAAGAKAQLLLDLAARKPQDGQHASWMLPLAANALLNAAPPAAPHLWLQVGLCSGLYGCPPVGLITQLAVLPCLMGSCI